MHLSKSFTVKILGVAMLLVLLMASVSVEANNQLPDYKPMDIGPWLREHESEMGLVTDEVFNGEAEAAASAVLDENECFVETKVWASADFYTGYYILSWFAKYVDPDVDSTMSEFWVQLNMSYPDGDPRATPEVTCDQAKYMIGQFDTNIYPIETDFFAEPNFHDGSGAGLPGDLGFPTDYYFDAEGKQVILVSNIRDDHYYDPTYPNLVVGFYSPTFEQIFFDRNIMSIDSHNWENWVGAPAYVYEGTFAHEYQHLLHDDSDPNEESWINEGLSMWAEPLTGYGVPTGYAAAVAANPENSLVIWGDQGGREIITDYGIAYLWAQYMSEQHTADYIKQIFEDSTLQGIASVDSYLVGKGTTFADSFWDFSIGMYTGGLFDLEELQDFQVDVGHPGQRNPDAYATPGAPPWGSDYILIWGPEQIANMSFNGYEFNPLGWTSDGSVLHSGAANSLDNWAIFEATGGGTLNFDTDYDIEVEWDYAFVQVSTDGGYTWTSLSNEYTTSDIDPNADPAIAANLPGLNGSSGGWVNMSFDLSAYPGDILIAMRYMTDGAVVNPGWFVDNISVDGTLISDGSSTDGLRSLNEVLGISNEYTITLIGERTRRGQVEYQVLDPYDGGFQFDDIQVRALFNNYKQVVMVVTYNAPQGVSSYADYGIVIDHRGGRNLR